jgi:hypothetical protein
MNKSNQEQCCSQNKTNDGLGVHLDLVEFNELVVSGRTLLESKSNLQSSATVGYFGMVVPMLAANSVEVRVSGSSSLESSWGGCCPSDNLLGFGNDAKTESGFEFLNASPANLDSSEWVMNFNGLNSVDNFGSDQENPDENRTSSENQSAIYGVSSSSCGCEGKGCKCSDNEHQDEVNPARSRTVDVGFEHVQNTTPLMSGLNQLLLAKKGN